MNIFNIALFLSLSFCTLSVSAKAPPPGTGKADIPANILLMLDTSGSMGRQTNQSRKFSMPTGIAVDSKGNQFIVEERYHKVLKFDSSGSLVKVIGGRRGRGNGQFYYPFHAEVDADDNLYVSDYANSRVQKFDNDGKWLKNFNGVSYASGVGVDDSGNVYVGARGTGYVHKFNPSGQEVTKWYTGYAPYGISIYGDTVYVANMWQCTQLKRYTRDGATKTPWSLNNGCYISSVEANTNGVYVTHTYNHYVDKYSHSGVYQTQVGTRGTGDGQFQYVWDIDSDSSGNIYVTDWYNHRVNKFDSDLTYLSDLAGNPSTRLDDAIKVIKKIVSDSELNKSANFGLMDWNTRARMQVNISSTGASEIYKKVGSLKAGGATYISNAMDLAKSYLQGSNTPIKYSCQKTMLIVITDGGFNGNVQKGYDIAKQLYTGRNNIPTVVISFYGGTQTTHKKLAEAGGTYTDDGVDNDVSPIEANSWQQLYIAISDMIRQTVESRQTFTKPVILPGVGGGDYIYQSTFVYKNFNNKLGTCTSDGKKSESCQWEGHLERYKLNKDGSLSDVAEWDAGKKLKAKKASNRQVWSMLKFMGADTTLNNFHLNNLIEIKMAIDEGSGKLSTDAEITSLINFVRGLDAYDEDKDGSTTDERWKLADIYHSELKVVGPPSLSTNNNINKVDTEAYYRYQKNYDSFKGGNRCGIGCPSRKEVVYAGANDGMLHAFDAKTGEELWAFIPPSMIKNLPKLSTSKPNTTNSIYGVDGSIVVRDIYFDKGKGKGSQWYTVLLAGLGRGDNSYFALDITNPNSPLFLFGFQNDSLNNKVYHWDGDGNRESLSYVAGILPEYDYSKLGESWSTPVILLMPNGTSQKWVAVFGAGYNGGVNTKYGSSIYVVDLENKGKVLKRIDLTDVSNNIANSVPTKLVAVTPDSTSRAKYKGAMLYFADLESKQWKINLTDNGVLYEVTPVFDAEATIENDRLDFFQLTPTIGNNDTLWNYYGTGNMQKVQRVSSDINNRIYGLKDKYFPKFNKVSGLKNTSKSSLKDTTTKGSICPSEVDLGWYVNLEDNERITGKLALYDEIVYATRYAPNKSNLCSAGNSTLTEHNTACGNTLRSTKLGQGIATGVVIYKDKIYIGISGGGSQKLKDEKGNIIGSRKGNLIVLTPTKGSKSTGTVNYESWREVF